MLLILHELLRGWTRVLKGNGGVLPTREHTTFQKLNKCNKVGTSPFLDPLLKGMRSGEKVASSGLLYRDVKVVLNTPPNL